MQLLSFRIGNRDVYLEAAQGAMFRVREWTKGDKVIDLPWATLHLSKV